MKKRYLVSIIIITIISEIFVSIKYVNNKNSYKNDVVKINELSSLDNALEVADTFGLKYNNSNIRVVSNEE